MVALLDLPRELRVKILNLVAAPSPAPPDPSVTGNRTKLHDVKYMSWEKHINVMYGVMYPQVCNRTDLGIPTLFVNRQLRSETLAALAHLSTRHSYTLDVMIANERALYPTWLCVPALTYRVDKVYAAFRIVGTAGTDQNYSSLFEGGDGGPPLIVWCFLSLLERFLRVGPVWHQEVEVDRGVSVKILELDVRTPNVPEDLLAPKDLRDYDDLRTVRRETGIDYIMPPEYLLDFIAQHVRVLLGNPIDYGELLYKRLGRIRLMLDGDLHEEWDLARIMANFGQCSGSFASWKTNAYKVRVQLDLPVILVEGEEIDGSVARWPLGRRILTRCGFRWICRLF